MDEVSAAWYRRQAAVALQASRKVEALWRQVDPDRITESWVELLPQAVTITTAGQVATSTQATEYVSAQVRQQGVEPEPEGKVNPLAFAGAAADGRPLESLLVLPAIAAKLRIARGLAPKDALLSGLGSLISMTSTEVADAGKQATQVALTADTTVKGYTRVVTLPACSRCIILGGRTYKWNSGFLRHPGCDCTHQPFTSTENAIAQGPNALFEKLTPEQQDKAFGKAGAKAIRDGADMSQVVNARRGMARPGAATTTEGTTRRGAYGRRSDARSPSAAAGETRRRRTTNRPERLTPEEIYRRAGDDRDEAIRLLTENAYLL
jgi:hypothetical protein